MWFHQYQADTATAPESLAQRRADESDLSRAVLLAPDFHRVCGRTGRRVPFAMSWPAWTGRQPSGHRDGVSRNGSPLILTTVKPARSSVLTTFPPEWPGGFGHQATSTVSVSSSGGPTSTSSASSASRRSATAASAVAPSPAAPTPGRSCAEVHQNAVFVLFYDVRHVDYAGPLPILPHQERGTDRRAWSYSASRIIADATAGLVRAACPIGPARRAGHADTVPRDTETGSGRMPSISGCSQ